MDLSLTAAPYTDRFVLAQDGLRLYARDYEPPRANDAAAVLCLAGMTRNSKDFAHVAAALAGKRRVICLDYRGRGLSAYDPDWRHYEPTVYLNDIVHLLTALNVHKVIVIGTSLGGLLAMGLAILRPGVMAGAVLNDIGPEISAGGLDYVLDYVERDRPQINRCCCSAAHLLFRTRRCTKLGAQRALQKSARTVIRFDGM
jgi:pimeloyl-ACP methyl ester carboxylesterase